MNSGTARGAEPGPHEARRVEARPPALRLGARARLEQAAEGEPVGAHRHLVVAQDEPPRGDEEATPTTVAT